MDYGVCGTDNTGTDNNVGLPESTQEATMPMSLHFSNLKQVYIIENSGRGSAVHAAAH